MLDKILNNNSNYKKPLSFHFLYYFIRVILEYCKLLYIIDWGTYDDFAIDWQTTVLEFIGNGRDVPLIPLLSNSYFRFYKVTIRTYLLIGRAVNRQTFFILCSFLYTWFIGN